jgi:hypothetical protein
MDQKVAQSWGWFKAPYASLWGRNQEPFMEIIAFLAFLKHGEQAKTNPPPPRPCNTSQNAFSLTFKHEITLGKAFALILVNIDDKSKVGAVCIEERDDHNGVSFCIATNFGSQEERQYAIDRIAKLLEHLSGTVPGQISDAPLSYLCPH